MRLCRIGLLALLLVLGACSTTVAGHGRSSAPASATFPSQSSPAAPAGVPAALRRSPVSSALGDPVVSDVCALITDSALSRFGEVTDPYGIYSDAFCIRGIDASGGQRLATVVVSVAAVGETPVPSGATATNVSGLAVYDATSSDGCLRVVRGSDVAVRINVYGNSASSVFCQAADIVTDSVVTQVAQQHKLPSRSVATANSLTQLNVCAAAKRAGLPGGIPALGNSTPTSYAFGGECDFTTPAFTLYLNDGFGEPDYLSSWTQLTVVDHAMYETSYDGGCRAASQQQQAAGLDVEMLLAEADTHSGTPAASLCQTATSALAKLLDAAGLS